METQKNNYVRPAQKNSQELLGNLPNYSDRFQEKKAKICLLKPQNTFVPLDACQIITT